MAMGFEVHRTAHHPHAMGSLNAKNLEALGAARLAELLMTLCEGNNASKRLLRLALAEQKGAIGDGAGAA
jgi:hypothetical protein